MTLSRRNKPLSHRLLSGLIAGLIVGSLLGMVIALRLTQVNESLYTSFLQSQLRLHLAAIYAILMLIPGLLVGAFFLSRRREVSMVEKGILILTALIFFYYGHNKLSIHIWSRFSSIRLPLEILGALGWAVVCWLYYKLMLLVTRRLSGWIVTISTLLVIVILAWSVFQVVRVPSAKGAVAKKPVLPAPAENVKVALIGIDGAWWEIADPLMKAGRLPVLLSLVNRGVRSQFQTILPTNSPLIWTTIATGKMPKKHHITSFRILTFPITGAMVPITKIPGSFHEVDWMIRSIIRQTPINSTFRMSEAIWNMLSDAGLTVGIINWWASFPAEPVSGYNISDHALYNKAMNVLMDQESGKDPHAVFPPALLPVLEPLVMDPMNVPFESVSRFIKFQSAEDWDRYINTKEYQVLDPNSEEAMFKFSYPEDVTMVQVALHLLKNSPQPDFFAIYLDGMDSMQHKYLPYYFHEQHRDMLTPDNIARFKDLVPEYYVYMDEVLGQLLAAMDPNTIIIVCSDHGFDHGIQMPNRTYMHQKAPPGVFVIAGDRIKKCVTIDSASVKDITPTILALFGLPIGRDMDGRVLTEAFVTEDMPITWVDTYDSGNRERGRIESSQMDKAILEKLKALGYFK